MSDCQVTVHVIAHPDPEEVLRVVAQVFLSDWKRSKASDASLTPASSAQADSVCDKMSQAQMSIA